MTGFRSMNRTALDLRGLNVLVGPNGAGKSNVVGCFKLINEMMGRRLQRHLATTGRASANLHFGPDRTPAMELELHFEVENGTDTYQMKLARVFGDTMAFADETLVFHQDGYPTPKVVRLGAGHSETLLGAKAEEGDITAKTLRYLLNRCRVFDFHDMSPDTRVRRSCSVSDHRWIMPDGGNLAAVLYRLRSERPTAYEAITREVRHVAPFFEDFDLTPRESGDIALNWRHRGADGTFGPQQFSEGTLRAICMIALLLQPRESRPLVIVLDEPEMGLHPRALDLVGSLFRRASRETQIIACTQSAELVDLFDPEDVLVVDRMNGATTFRRHGEEALEQWIDSYVDDGEGDDEGDEGDDDGR